MKICAIGLRGIPDVMGGIESHCEALYPRLVDQHDITVIARSPYVDDEYYFKGVHVIPIWTIQHKLIETFLHTFLALCYARFIIKPDVVHLHAIGPALFAPLARLMGMRVVVTHHGADYNRQKWSRFAKWMLRLGEKSAVLFANRVIVVGKSLTQELQQRYPNRAQCISYIPNGAFASFARTPTALTGLNLGLKAKHYILAVGRLVPEKGFLDLIKAHAISDSDLPLVITGGADHQDAFVQELHDCANSKVIFAGKRMGDELQSLYANAERFVLPSYHEGLPIVALEAISAGTDVLLSNIKPNLDIGLNTGNYYPVGNIDSLAQALSAPLPSVNSALILEQFNWDKIAQSTANVFADNTISAITRGAY